MRDLFRFLLRIRDTLLFITLMVVAGVLLYSGSMHHRAIAINGSNAVAGTFLAWRSQAAEYTSLREVNARLAAENADWRNRHSSAFAPVADPLVRINDSLHHQQYSCIPAKVVGSTWHKQRNYVTLDKGVSNGVLKGMGVIGPDGIVGVVHDASARFASAISVLNPEVKTSVKLKRTGNFGLLYWDTGDPATASMVDIPKHVRVAPGDTVVTMGGDGVYPTGAPVGVVTQVSSPPGRPDQAVVVRLFEDLTRSGYVYVVNDLQRAERDSLLQRQEQE